MRPICSDLDRLLPTGAWPCKLLKAHPLAKLKDQMSEPWTSVDDIARHLGVARDSIYRWIDRRRMPAHRIGRLWKFKISEVDDWVRGGGAGSDAAETRKQ
jgi:excisionase family DNA binding protein